MQGLPARLRAAVHLQLDRCRSTWLHARVTEVAAAGGHALMLARTLVPAGLGG